MNIFITLEYFYAFYYNVGAGLGGAAAGADLGGSSKYSNENFEGRRVPCEQQLNLSCLFLFCLIESTCLITYSFLYVFIWNIFIL